MDRSLCAKDEHIMWGCDVTDTGIESERERETERPKTLFSAKSVTIDKPQTCFQVAVNVAIRGHH